MSKEQFGNASECLYDRMVCDGIKGIMQYKPFSEKYWEQQPKIVICNYENFGYQDYDKPSLLTYEDFKWWFDERINKVKKIGKSKTVHFSVVFAYALQKVINNKCKEQLMSYQELRKLYWKYDELYQSMKNVMYMNIRPTSAKSNKQEIKEATEIIVKYKSELRSYIKSLDADILILSSKDSVRLFNIIFETNDKPLMFKKEKRIDDMLVFSVKHFGRPDYRYWHKKIIDIYNLWNSR